MTVVDQTNRSRHRGIDRCRDHLCLHHLPARRRAGERAASRARSWPKRPRRRPQAPASRSGRVRCLANCTRGPSAAMRCNGSWTYVFGELDVACAAALIEGARLLAGAPDGIMPWRGRPEPLKRGLIARMPPIDFRGGPRMTASLARVPCTIVTGFLGAGKTTLIRHVLANAQGRRLAVIVNEFGDVGIDGEILKGCGDAACPEENIVELANGCLCCTVADEFVPALDTILDAHAGGRAHRDRDLRPGAAQAAGAGVPLAGDQEPRHRRRRGGGGGRRGGRRRTGRRRPRRAGAPARRRHARSITTTRSRRCSRIRSPAPTSWC